MTSVTVHEAIRYGAAPDDAHPDAVGADRVLDLLEPDTDALQPLLLNVHGGAWIGGSRHAAAEPCGLIAADGVLVANIDYAIPAVDPVAPIVRDVAAALAWVRRREHPALARWNDRVVLCGDSAGAHAALLTAVALANPEVAEALDVPALDQVDGLVLWSGALDLGALDVPAESEYAAQFAAYLATLGGGRSGPALAAHLETIDPAMWFDEPLPPALAFSSTTDFFGESTDDWVTASQDAGNSAHLVWYGDEVPDAVHSWQQNPVLTPSRQTCALTAAFARTV